MFIRIISDIHNEDFRFDGNKFKLDSLPTDKDTVLIAAGDIDEGEEGIKFLREYRCNFHNIIYVPGNHEYYHNSVIELNSKFDEVSDFHAGALGTWFDEKTNINYIWATLWVSFDNENPLIEFKAPKMVNDYKYIYYNNSLLNTLNVKSMFYSHLEYIKNKLIPDTTNIVITHHSPSSHKNNPEFNGRVERYLYNTDLNEFILDHPEIKYWIHGHVHDSKDFEIGGTRIICNPHGYISTMVNKSFDPNLVIEI